MKKCAIRLILFALLVAGSASVTGTSAADAAATDKVADGAWPPSCTPPVGSSCPGFYKGV